MFASVVLSLKEPTALAIKRTPRASLAKGIAVILCKTQLSAGAKNFTNLKLLIIGSQVLSLPSFRPRSPLEGLLLSCHSDALVGQHKV